MKAIIYTRVSTDDQADSGLGLESQETECRRYAERESWTVGGVFVDAGVSGAADLSKRQALVDALGELKRGDVFLVYKLDRLGRDVALCAIIEKQIKNKRAQLVSVSGEGTAADEDDLGALLQRRMVSVIAEYEREIIRQRTKAALKAKRARGEKLGGRRPIGYKVENRGGVKVLVPNSEQKDLEAVLALYVRGVSIRKIADQLSTKARTWHPTQVARIINRHKAQPIKAA